MCCIDKFCFKSQELADAAMKERERIIKLLEDNGLTAASELIEQNALIKGENK